MQALLLWNGLIFAPRFSLITFANLRTDLINVMRETASQEAALWSWPVRLILQGLLHPLVSSLLFFVSPGLVVSLLLHAACRPTIQQAAALGMLLLVQL